MALDGSQVRLPVSYTDAHCMYIPTNVRPQFFFCVGDSLAKTFVGAPVRATLTNGAIHDSNFIYGVVVVVSGYTLIVLSGFTCSGCHPAVNLFTC